MENRIRGVLAPVVTPFNGDLSPDPARFVEHCKWLISQDAGLAFFGTNSEANSLTVAERLGLMDVLFDSGVDPARTMPGTGCCALGDAVDLTRKAVGAGCSGVLMLPPFFYKGVSDEGLFRFYSEVVQRVGDDRLRIYLYHIPPVAQVPVTAALIERLLKAYPGTVAGIKDSSGDWGNTEMLLENFQSTEFDVFCGSEVFLLKTLRLGGAGSITATANVNPAMIHALYLNWRSGDAELRQEKVAAIRRAFEGMPLIPALKCAISWQRRDPQWLRVRPPLVGASDAKTAELRGRLEELGYAMPDV